MSTAADRTLTAATSLQTGDFVIDSVFRADAFMVCYHASDRTGQPVIVVECFPEYLATREGGQVVAQRPEFAGELAEVQKLFRETMAAYSGLKDVALQKCQAMFEANGTQYAVFDDLPGRSIAELVRDGAARPIPIAIEKMVGRLLSGVSTLHAAGMLHLNITPATIIVGGQLPVLALPWANWPSAGAESRRAYEASLHGSPYAPVELYGSAPSATRGTDLYALAASFYLLMTGEAPSDSQERQDAIIAGGDSLRPLSEFSAIYSPTLIASMTRALQFDPADRQASVADWLNDVGVSAESATATADVAEAAPAAEAFDRRDPLADFDEPPADLPGDVRPRRADLEEVPPSALPPGVPGIPAAMAPAEPPPVMGVQSPAAAAAVPGAVEPEVDAAIQNLLAEEARRKATEIGGSKAAQKAAKKAAAVQETESTPRPAAAAVAAPRPAAAPAQSKSGMPMILAGAGVLVLAVGGWLAFGGGDAPPPPVEVVAAAETPPEVKPEPAPEVKPEPAPVETAEVKPEPVPEPVPEPAPETAPGDAPVPEAETEIAAVAAPPAETPADTPVTPPASEQAPATAEPAAQAISPPADQTAAVAAEPPAPAPKPGKRDFDLTEAVGDLGQPEAQEVALAAMPIPEIISAPAAPIATMDAASADGSASVDLAAPEAPPAPEPEPVPEPQPEPQPVEASAVEAKVTVNLPFQAASGAANVIGALNANADEWMIPGQKIVTVNNVEIAAISEIPAILEATGALRAIGEVPVSYGIAAADGSIVVRSSTVKVAKSVSLKNGMIFELRTGISGEETVVISAPSGGEDQIRVGDVVIGYVTTNERLSPDLNIADLLNREIAIGNTTHTFAVRRGEFNTVVTLQYDGTGR